VVVLVLHGGGGDGSGMRRLSGFDAAADRYGFVAVYPDGYRRSWADGCGASAADRAGGRRGGEVSVLGTGGRGEVRSAPDTAAAWASIDRCVGPPAERDLPDTTRDATTTGVRT
jgi:poly(3-hydroxybutyrate) depolymerase